MHEQETNAKNLEAEGKVKKTDKIPSEKVLKEEKIVAQTIADKNDNLGEINISTEVLGMVVNRIVSNIAGVTGLFAHSKSGFGTLLGVKEIEEGIRVDLIDGKSVSFYISVIVGYGSIIIDLAKNIQSIVKKEVEEKTGLLVKSVDINVMGIQMSDKDSKVKSITKDN